MLQLFKVGSYLIYFRSNEGKPTEPVHVHIAQNHPISNGTKIWISSAGKVLLCNNDACIAFNDLRKLMRIIEANSEDIIERWESFFGDVSYYC